MCEIWAYFLVSLSSLRPLRLDQEKAYMNGANSVDARYGLGSWGPERLGTEGLQVNASMT